MLVRVVTLCSLTVTVCYRMPLFGPCKDCEYLGFVVLAEAAEYGVNVQFT